MEILFKLRRETLVNLEYLRNLIKEKKGSDISSEEVSDILADAINEGINVMIYDVESAIENGGEIACYPLRDRVSFINDFYFRVFAREC